MKTLSAFTNVFTGFATGFSVTIIGLIVADRTETPILGVAIGIIIIAIMLELAVARWYREEKGGR